MAETKVLFCVCDHEYQDKTYGPKKRLHNQYIRESGGWRCTVCDRQRSGNED